MCNNKRGELTFRSWDLKDQDYCLGTICQLILSQFLVSEYKIPFGLLLK